MKLSVDTPKLFVINVHFAKLNGNTSSLTVCLCFLNELYLTDIFHKTIYLEIVLLYYKIYTCFNFVIPLYFIIYSKMIIQLVTFMLLQTCMISFFCRT